MFTENLPLIETFALFCSQAIRITGYNAQKDKIMPLLHAELTSQILEASFEVINELGAGFLEAVYQNALLIALRQKGLTVIPQHPFQVKFRGEIIGNF